MYTLKVHFTRHEAPAKGEAVVLTDEWTQFIEADEVTVFAHIKGDEVEQAMHAWETDSYQNALGAIHYDGTLQNPQFANGRIIQVKRNGVSRWVLASRAWLVGPDGKTIERIAP